MPTNVKAHIIADHGRAPPSFKASHPIGRGARYSCEKGVVSSMTL